ncbi:MAG: hypothetical protein WC184_09310 [Acidimicrobiia bacterium]
MITLGAKIYFGLSVIAIIAAAIFGLATDASLLGVLSFGWSGPIGDQHAYILLMSVALAAFFMGVVTTAYRDADPQAVLQLAGGETLPVVEPPATIAPWPPVAAMGLALVMIGLVAAPFVFGVGILVLAIATVEWTVLAWSDSATGSAGINRAIRHRVMSPVEVPAAAVLLVFTFVFFVSRILLSLSQWGALAAFALTGAVILLLAIILSNRDGAGRAVVATVLILGGLAIVVGGLIGVAVGEREFHQAGGGSAAVVVSNGHELVEATDAGGASAQASVQSLSIGENRA